MKGKILRIFFVASIFLMAVHPSLEAKETKQNLVASAAQNIIERELSRKTVVQGKEISFTGRNKGNAADMKINAAVEEKGKVVDLNKVSLPDKRIEINLASRLLKLYENDKLVKEYVVAVGSRETPSPLGEYAITEKEINPQWIDPKTLDVMESGPWNPLGYRWLGFYGTYGIHGTNAPRSIGKYVSQGCIRMDESQVENLYELTPLGTPVKIIYERIVIEREKDHTVSYRIYPDGYEWQPSDITSVKKALSLYGVEDFAEPSEIIEKLEKSDGSRTYIAKDYDLIVDGRKLEKKALGKDGQIWLPAVALSVAVKTGAYWDEASHTLMSLQGKVKGIVKSDVVYINAEEAAQVFPVRGKLTKDLTYEIEKVTTEGNKSQ